MKYFATGSEFSFYLISRIESKIAYSSIINKIIIFKLHCVNPKRTGKLFQISRFDFDELAVNWKNVRKKF